MSLPPELRVLCHQLSSIPSAQLPNTTPVLLRNVYQCQGPLSSQGNNAAKSDASESSVLIHKLKTQISSLLYGKSPEGRFTAVVLIKAIVEVGGWEVLRGAESWVRGLLAVLSKPDSVATKRLCILSLTSIYLMTHQYQSLVREMTTPTLPTFVSSCLGLVSSKSSSRALDTPSSLMEAVFESFSALIPRHPAIFRPSTQQIRLLIRPYMAPTLCDRRFVSPSLSQSARRLAVLLHQTAAKNTSGEEWGKAVRELVKEIHGTTDQVYRAVIEDWESAVGYVSQPADISQELHGAAKAEGDLPAWSGIDAGLERLVGLLNLLEEHFKHPTAAVVTIPLGIIIDLLTRLMSVAPPMNVKGSSDYRGMRLHPAVERSEREGLWASLGHVHVASMQVYIVLMDRLQQTFTSMAHDCLDQVTWTFPSGHHDETFRSVAYQVTSKALPLCESGLCKPAVDRLIPMIRSCCRDFKLAGDHHGSSANAETFLYSKTSLPGVITKKASNVLNAATDLLPLLLLHLPQQYLEGYLRAEIDRTAIIAHHEQAMVASVLNPFVGKDGRYLASILPHLSRAFAGEGAIEAFLRPRLPVLWGGQVLSHEFNSPPELLQDEDKMVEDLVAAEMPPRNDGRDYINLQRTIINSDIAPEDSEGKPAASEKASTSVWGVKVMDGEGATGGEKQPLSSENRSLPPPVVHSKDEVAPNPSRAKEYEDDSDESVHLTMELSDSEDESFA